MLSAWAANKQRVRVHKVALSNESGKAKLYIPIDSSGIEHDSSASIEHDNFPKNREQEVGLCTLDSYGFQGVKLIKIDVEGHEYNVIQGAKDTICSSTPAMLIEIEQRHSSRPIGDVFEKLNELGYSIFFLGPSGLSPFIEIDAERDQDIDNFGQGKKLYINNFLFLHRDKLASGEYRSLFDERCGQ